jgi:hypothetical protein
MHIARNGFKLLLRSPLTIDLIGFCLPDYGVYFDHGTDSRMRRAPEKMPLEIWNIYTTKVGEIARRE